MQPRRPATARSETLPSLASSARAIAAWTIASTLSDAFGPGRPGSTAVGERHSNVIVRRGSPLAAIFVTTTSPYGV